MKTSRLLVAAVSASVLWLGCKKEEKEDQVQQAVLPAVTVADYLGEYTASAQGSSATFVMNVFSGGGNDLRLVSTWGLYTGQEEVSATFSNNNLSVAEQEFYAVSIGTSGSTRRTVSGSGTRSGNTLQLNLTSSTYYTPELGGGLYASQVRNISAFRN